MCGLPLPWTIFLCALGSVAAERVAGADAIASASSAAEGFGPGGAIDHDRFSTNAGAAWKGTAEASNWWWQVKFELPTKVGAILQVMGDHPFVLRDAPQTYVWQRSDDGNRWIDIPSTATANEARIYRLHRLPEAVSLRFLRLSIRSATGPYPTLREVEIFAHPQDAVSFPDWIVAVNSTHDPKLPNHGQEFIPLAKSCEGWQNLQAQQVWIGAIDPAFVETEPRPLCAFLSGSFKDWCEVDRETWRGMEKILNGRELAIWASCGGAQGLAILAETGVDRPWDCPHCRDPKSPRLPIYGHIGHTAQRPCGDYSGCIFERGPHWIRPVTRDPVFSGLPGEFQVMESHCGQIEWAPRGWSLIATGGTGTQTKTQCLRMNGRLVYAAQFHIEMAGTPEVSRKIMSNFLGLARSGLTRDAESLRPR